MAPTAPTHDVVVAAAGPAAAAAEMAVHLGAKGFCVVDPGLGAGVFQQACREAEALSATERLQQPPALICDGLLGAEGSAHILHLKKLDPLEAPSLLRVEAAMNELSEWLGGGLPGQVGFECRFRTHSVLHETGMPAESAPELTEDEASSWLGSFSRAKVMVCAVLGPIKGTMELDPFDQEAEPFEFATLPGSIVVLRADLMTHKHFAHSRAFVLSTFLLDGEPGGRKEEAMQTASMPPVAVEIENWAVKRLQELKEEEHETGRKVAIPEGWRSAMDRMFHTEQRCAVRGMAARFCSTWNVFNWHSGHLGGSDFATSVPLKRWDHDVYFDADPEGWRRNKTSLNHGSFAEGLELFDCRFFGLSPMEASGMDPHQRQVLEVGYEACHRAGYKKGKLMNCCAGVYLGSSMTIFGRLAPSGATGSAASINSNRFSYCLGMKGPSLTVDTEASSSLSAVYLGADGVLEKGRGVLNAFSLAGGVYLNLGTLFWPQMEAAGLTSRVGRCMSWDSSADGHCFGDGVGLIVQKRLTETVDGERVYVEGEHLEGIIASSVMNSSGMTASMHSPHGPSDQELVSDALRGANISGANVDAVECDGRAGFMGDAVEVDSLARVLRGNVTDEVAGLGLMSTKSRMGNGVEVAGISSVIRVLLGNRGTAMTPNCHLFQLNPYIEPEHKVNFMSECLNFTLDNMYVGVTAKGFGGTNAHAILFGKPDSVDEAVERKTDPLWFWPGGGGELEDAQVPQRSYCLAGTWSRWQPAPMQSEGGGSFGLTVVLGDLRWEEFQIFLDGDAQRRLHPGQRLGSSGSLVAGPEDAASAKGLNWRIGQRRGTAGTRAIEESAAGSLLGQAAEAGTGSTAAGREVALLDSAAAGRTGAAQLGDTFRVRLQVSGKFRTVTWEKLPEATPASSLPDGAFSSFSIAADWNGWTFDAMQRDGDAWHADVLLLRPMGDFQVVRNADWNQVVRPERPHASAADRGCGPEDASNSQGLSWCIEGNPGDVFRITMGQEAEADAWQVSWQRLRSEPLTDEQAEEAKRPRFGVVGSWTDFAVQQALRYEGSEGLRTNHSFFVSLGSDATESFQLLQDYDWNSLVHPDRLVEGAQAPHRVMESAGDGSALDLVWQIGGAADQASPGAHFKVVVTAASGRVVRVSWERADEAELGAALAEGRVLQRT